MIPIRSAWIACSALLLFGASGCVLAPKELKDEESDAARMGKPYQAQFEERTLPELPSPAGWPDVLSRAFLANGELEAGYFEWRAALERVKAQSSWPNTNLAPSFSYMFSSEAKMMKSFDRTMGMVAFDPMQNLSLPNKIAQSGKVAFAEALAARERFRAMKFDPNEPAYPIDAGHYFNSPGFTKREALIKGAWEALLTEGDYGVDDYHIAAINAVKAADALIAELSKEQS